MKAISWSKTSKNRCNRNGTKTIERTPRHQVSQDFRRVSQDDGRVKSKHLLKNAKVPSSGTCLRSPIFLTSHKLTCSRPLGTLPRTCVPFPSHSFAVALSRPLPLPGWWSDYPVALCVSRQVRGPCVCKGLASFSINIMAGLATFPRSANNSRGGESGWSISSVCLQRSWPTLIL